MKILSTIFAVFFLFTFGCTICFLFHIGAKSFTSASMYDKFAAIAFLESCFFFLMYLKFNNLAK